MTHNEDGQLRVVIFKEGDLWVGQCLEYDISAQGPDVATVTARLEATLEAERELASSEGKSPYHGIGKAPQHFFDMWDRRPKIVSEEQRVALALCA